jgi:hypothetical protein
MMNRKAAFPIFNGVICAGLGAVVGYYLNQLARGFILGFLIGLLIGIMAEWLLGKLGDGNWLYKRRVLLMVLVEIPLAVFIMGPYAFAVKETLPNQHAVCCDTPLDYGAETYEDICIETDDGITLAGWYVPPPEESGAVIILLHGAHGDRTGTAWHARQLIDAGYGVLFYDQRALGSQPEKWFLLAGSMGLICWPWWIIWQIARKSIRIALVRWGFQAGAILP